MAYQEKPPIMSGDPKKDVLALRDYLFRLAGSLEPVASAQNVSVTKDASGRTVEKPGGTNDEAIKAMRKNAQELKALIIKSAKEVEAYADSKVEVYNGMYVAKSDFGDYREETQTRIETTAGQVNEMYEYKDFIESGRDDLLLLQQYVSAIDGEIRRGIVLDPDTIDPVTGDGEYVTGIAISQRLSFEGECGPTDSHNPGDGYTYYYLTQGQTFGLYTSTGWQFWIDGTKRGWFDSVDGMLHVANVLVENTLQLGDDWQVKVTSGMLEFYYVG